MISYTNLNLKFVILKKKKRFGLDAFVLCIQKLELNRLDMYWLCINQAAM